jgi:hypothetical protein
MLFRMGQARSLRCVSIYFLVARDQIVNQAGDAAGCRADAGAFLSARDCADQRRCPCTHLGRHIAALCSAVSWR